MATSAVFKRDKAQDPQVETLDRDMAAWGKAGMRMVISTPKEVDGLIRAIPKGKLASTDTLRGVLAKRHKVDVACPMTTGIFVGISAKAAVEEEETGAKRIAPWWRVVMSDGKLREKSPGGVAEHKRRLAAEGFKFTPAGKNWRVAGWESKLAKLG